MKFYLFLLIFALFGCQKIEIKDTIIYADKGSLGAVQLHTLQPGMVDIDKAAWDQARVGMLCMDAGSFADWKKNIETLCSLSKDCDYQAISSFLDRVDEAHLVNDSE